MNRGEIWWADLAEPRGSEPGSRRPVLIVQNDLLNRSRLHTVLVAPLTTNMDRAKASGNGALRARESGLARDSVVLTCQVLTLDRDFLTECVGRIPRRLTPPVDAGLMLVLDLT